MDTPNADRFMAILDLEYAELIEEALKAIDHLERALREYAHSEYEQWHIRRNIALYKKDIEYYSKGAENGTSPTVNTTETPHNTTANGQYIMVLTEDMCILGM